MRRMRAVTRFVVTVLVLVFLFEASRPSALAGTQDPLEPMPIEMEIPFALHRGFMIVVEGRIGPLTHLRFILDTSATHTMVDRKLADALKLERRPGSVFNFDKFIPIEWADFPSIQVGPIEAKNISLMVVDLAQLSEADSHVDAVIGMDLLRLNGRLRINYNSRKVVFSPLTPFEPHIPPTDDPACLAVDVPVQGQIVRLIVDTGIEGILLYRDRVFRRNPKLRLENEVQQVRSGGRLLPGLATMGNIHLPNGDFSARIYVIDAPPENELPNIDGYLSTAALQARELDFDFLAHKFRWK